MCLEINQVCSAAKGRPKGAGILDAIGPEDHVWNNPIDLVVAVFTQWMSA